MLVLKSGVVMVRLRLIFRFRLRGIGFHDDCVMALALANHRRWETESCGPMMPLTPKGRFSPFAARPRILPG
jgi:hypothetical protein